MAPFSSYIRHCILLSPSTDFKQTMALYCVILLILSPWRPLGTASATGLSINKSEIDLKAPISRILVSEYFGVYVGGTNFVAQLSSQLHLLYRFSIGPVQEPEHCWPDPAPCDNTVRILEADHQKQLLLVCGSAYQGTCTLHSMGLIYDYFCVHGRVTNESSPTAVSQQPSPGVLAAVGKGDTPVFSQALDDSIDWRDEEREDVPGTTAHFFQTENINDRRQGPEKPDFFTFTACRSIQFGEQVFLDKGQKMNEPVRNSRQAVGPGALYETDFPSTLMVAGTVHFKSSNREGDGSTSSKSRESPLPLSVREMVSSGPQYTISYAPGLDQDTPRGFQLAEPLSSSMAPPFFQDYKLSFTHGNFSYQVFLQRRDACGDNECVKTRVSRVCHESPTLSPYVDIPIACRYQAKVYKLLTSVVLGYVDIHQGGLKEQVPVLLAAFGAGRARAPGSGRVDARQGAAVCAFPIEKLNKLMDSATKMCNKKLFLATSATWISGSNASCVESDTAVESCSPDMDNPYVRGTGDGDSKALTGFRATAVGTLWSYTPRTFTTTGSVLSQRLSLFIMTLDGIISKIVLAITRKNNEVQVDMSSTGISEYYRLDIDLVNANGTWNGKHIPVGDTDDTRAFMYTSNGHKVQSLALDYCRQFRSCESCVSHVDICWWCPAEHSCRGEESTVMQCKGAESSICPPQLTSYSPHIVPSEGGSVLTLLGSRLGSETDEPITVDVSLCGQPCDNVVATGQRATCTVRRKCDSCSDYCRLNVTVTDASYSSYFLSEGSYVKYANPQVNAPYPTFGPVSGSTRVSLTGKNLVIGSNITMTVAGAECKVSVIQASSELLCDVVGNKSRKLECGDVEIRIDNFKQTVGQFCFRRDPVIKKIYPDRSIESGGIPITIKGTHFDSVTSYHLALTLDLPAEDSNNVTKQTYQEGSCINPDGSTEIIICPSPKVPGVEALNALIRERSGALPSPDGQHISMGLQLVLDNRNVLEDYSDANGGGGDNALPTTFVVYRDPTLFSITPGTGDAFVDVRNPVLNIRCKNFPIWLPFDDIKITIGNWTCPVRSMTEELITCDGAEAAGFVVEEMNKLVTEAPETSLTTETSTSLTSQGPNDESFTERDPKVVETTTQRDYPKKKFTPFVTRKKMPGSKVPRNSRKKRPGKASRSKQSSDLVRNMSRPIQDHDDSNQKTAAPSEEPMKEFSIEFMVKIEIGYLAQHLGDVHVGYDPTKPNPTSSPAPEEGSRLVRVAIPAAIGAVVLFLVAASLLCCQFVKTRRRAREMEKMAPYYMGSLSGSGPGSKEATQPTLKQILESIMEPNRKSEVDNLIIQLDRLTIGKSIGSGNFGCVYEGMLTSDDGGAAKKVAVKTLQDSASQSLDLKSFVQEAVFMKDFRHPHVLSLVGLAERAGPEAVAPYVILPYMENGDLLTYIRDVSVSLSLHDVIKFGADIANGMEYLSSLKFVHRDLAARNCMLDSSQRAKVADFGLCRDIYEKGYYTSDNRKKLPIRWMAVESIEHGAYSTKSDVWSFGVVLWELSCRGVTPYPGVDGWDVINYLRKRRLAPPFFCPDELYNIMMNCWAKDPDCRPEFKTLHADLLALIGLSPSPAKVAASSSKRRQSGNSTLPPYANYEHGQVKLPEVVGPMGKRAMQKESSKAKAENDLEQGGTDTAYKNVPCEGESVSVNMEGSGDVKRPSVTVTAPPKVAIKNVLITIPACFSHRDLSRNAAEEYIKLVDNYEPAPKFSNSIKLKVKRSKKKSRQSEKDRESVEERHKKPPIMPRSSKTKSGVSDAVDPNTGYSSLVLVDYSDGASRGSFGRKEGNYFELETGVRASAAGSDGASGRYSGRSSVASLLENQSGRFSPSPSADRASRASSRASTPQSRRSSLAQQVGGSARNSSNSGKQIAPPGYPHSSSRPYAPVPREESTVIDDEISSCFDTEL